MALPSSGSMATTQEALSFLGGMGDDTRGYDSDDVSEGFEDDEIPNPLTGDESKTSSTEPDLTVFRTNLSIVMKHVINTDQTVDWENELAQKSSEQWCNELYPFVPTQVKVAFNNPDLPPTVNELWSLPFFGIRPFVLESNPNTSRSSLSFLLIITSQPLTHVHRARPVCARHHIRYTRCELLSQRASRRTGE